MAWSEFKFARDQRVIVPNNDGIQGLVTGRLEFKNGENAYHVTYLADDLTLQTVMVAEVELAAAQPIVSPVATETKTAQGWVASAAPQKSFRKPARKRKAAKPRRNKSKR